MRTARDHSAKPTLLGRVPHIVIVPVLLAVAAVLAFTSLLTDSITFDETAHLTAGFSYLKTGDFRLQPEHPPLPKILAALPLLWMEHNWPPTDTPDWREGDHWDVGRSWLFDAADGERLLVAARSVMVLLLLGTCLTVYALARRLFGRDAGLLALTLSVFSPTLLAHGRLVTNDVSVAVVITLALLLFARVLERLTWGRLIGALLTAAALPLVKFSWPLALPPLALMSLVAVAWRRAPTLALRRVAGQAGARQRGEPTGSMPRPERALVFGVLVVASALIAWAAIWTCYGWRYSPFRGPDRDVAMFTAMPDPGQPAPTTLARAWETILHDNEGRPMRGVLPHFIRLARDHRLFPEAYLYGLAHTLRFTNVPQPAYLAGEVYLGGRPSYFPIAFAVKTPIPTLLLLMLGIAALGLGKAPLGRDPTLLVGVLSFGALFAVVSITSDLNIGHRHILPLYPVVFALAGGAAGWLSKRVGQAAILIGVAWTAFAALRIHPNYLGYFNEFVGGPTSGHLYLADSNVDWGQNLKRLARYAKDHPDESILLSYFGSAGPRRYGFACKPLPSFLPFGEPGELTAGTYVISVNYLLGILEPTASDETWQNQKLRRYYRRLHAAFGHRAARMAALRAGPRRLAELQRYGQLRWGRLLHQLRHRGPDERIGYALFAFRLTQEDVNRLIGP